jgi:hypothetical protein
LAPCTNVMWVQFKVVALDMLALVDLEFGLACVHDEAAV